MGGPSDISHSVVIKDGDLFFLSEPDGSVPLTRDNGFGLYYHDCRFLNGYELTIDGQKPGLLASKAAYGYKAALVLSNSQFSSEDRTFRTPPLKIRWSRMISGEQLTLFDRITFQNLTSERISFSFSLSFRSQFEDLFAIRGYSQKTRGVLHDPTWKDGALHFLYEGADIINRETIIHFSPSPTETQSECAYYAVELSSEERKRFFVSLAISESAKQSARVRADARRMMHRASHSKNKPAIRSDSFFLNNVMNRSLRDLEMLQSHLGIYTYFAAGVPWYVALFGRDSIVTALQTLAYDPEIAEQTIRLLAAYQGKEPNPWRDEEPGKILHELRVGEMAHLNEIPHTPYYGTIDATPLWLVLIGRHAAWSGDLQVFNELRPNIEAALNWIEHYGDFNRDGYVEYKCRSEGGLVNQGWKDSGDGIVNADGSLGVPPIALVEVQGYVYDAKILMASLYRRADEEKRATLLESEAQQLRERFNRDFWVADGYFALALQEGKRQAAVLSSNAGHTLWSGIAEHDRAKQCADHLLSPEMFSGWGIRTLSAASARYSPLAYHLGTIWPHDNSLIAAGFKRYGFDDAALRIFNGMLESAARFENNRLPELFGGFAREAGRAPAAYPIACQPQAWAAGTIPYLLTVILGLEPNAFDRELRIVRPRLPENIDRVKIDQLCVGAARIDLLFERHNGVVVADVQKIEGDLQLVLES